METTMTTEKNYTIEYEDSYAHVFYLEICFNFDEIEYVASGYYSHDKIDDFDLLNLKTDEYIINKEYNAYKLGLELLQKLGRRKLSEQ